MFNPDEGQSVDSSLKESMRMLSKLSRYISSAEDLSVRMESCRLELDDILSEIASLNDGIDVSQERLVEVEDRMSLIYGLLKKHGCADEAELIVLRDRLSEELYDSTVLEEQAGDLRERIDALTVRLEDVAAQLHDGRSKSAPSFAENIMESLRYMELPYAVFDVQMMSVPLCATGTDAVVFRFSASGNNPVDVAKCASGGEMSRIMLSLKAMMAHYTDMPTMIFDEIDTGVSGSVADKMGTMICRMGENMQVFAITHLPQVAAKGNAHYMVSKEIDPSSSKAVSTIVQLNAEERVMEVARMLSGSTITEAAIANAESLLS